MTCSWHPVSDVNPHPVGGRSQLYRGWGLSQFDVGGGQVDPDYLRTMGKTKKAIEMGQAAFETSIRTRLFEIREYWIMFFSVQY